MNRELIQCMQYLVHSRRGRASLFCSDATAREEMIGPLSSQRMNTRQRVHFFFLMDARDFFFFVAVAQSAIIAFDGFPSLWDNKSDYAWNKMWITVARHIDSVLWKSPCVCWTALVWLNALPGNISIELKIILLDQNQVKETKNPFNFSVIKFECMNCYKGRLQATGQQLAFCRTIKLSWQTKLTNWWQLH